MSAEGEGRRRGMSRKILVWAARGALGGILFGVGITAFEWAFDGKPWLPNLVPNVVLFGGAFAVFDVWMQWRRDRKA